MKTLRLVGMALVVALLGVGTYACSDDDVCECTGEGFCSCIGDDFCTCTGESVDSSDDAVEDDTPTLPASGTINGYEYVDLGLSVKWATCNVGASSPSDYGGYFAWGEILTKLTYTGENSVTHGKNIGNIASDPEYDAARANWGSTWRLPMAGEIEELRKNCEWTWIMRDGIKGYKVTGPSGNGIFLPAAGWRSGEKLYDAGGSGRYWSGTPSDATTEDGAYNPCFYAGYTRWSYGYRFVGRSVRPVSE